MRITSTVNNKNLENTLEIFGQGRVTDINDRHTMKLFSTEHKFQYFKPYYNPHNIILRYPWETVSSANWLKYPNEKTPHVTNVDYLWRHIDPQTGFLHTARLITCKQAGPALFASMFAGSDSNAMAYEESVVDPRGRVLTVRSKNLTLANLVTVEETCTYTPSQDSKVYHTLHTCSYTYFFRTIFKQEAQIAVTGWLQFKDKIEDFCIKRFQMNASNGRSALEEVLDRVYEETKESLTDMIRDVTGIPMQHPEDTTTDIKATPQELVYLD